MMACQKSALCRFTLLCLAVLLLVASFVADAAFPVPSDADEKLFPGLNNVQPANNLIVPSVVHQIYDYQNPNFFLYLSLICVQRYIRPERHILWVNDEGRYRKGHWQSWQNNANNQVTKTWEFDLTELIRQNKIEVKFLTFPMHPPGNSSTYAPNKAHRSDFVRLEALTTIGGIYLDTDAFVINNLAELRQHNFTMSFDNIVNPDKSAPKRLNNGVMLAAPQSQFLHLWAKKYAQFNPESFDFDSSVVPYNLMTQYPDLIHLEMSRIAPMSFAFQTARIAEILTCGLYVPPVSNKEASLSRRGAIWAPKWDGKSHSFENTQPDEYAYTAMEKKFVLHLTMSQVRCVLTSYGGIVSIIFRAVLLLHALYLFSLSLFTFLSFSEGYV